MDDGIKAQLRARAVRHGRSLEEEARVVLSAAAVEPPASGEGPGTQIARLFAEAGGFEIERKRDWKLRPMAFDDNPA